MAFDWIQYQGETQPVSTAKETVTESRWHQPWSEPVRQKISPVLAVALIASGVVFTPAQPFPETTTVTRYHRPFAEPVRVRLGLLTGEQPFFTAPPRVLVASTFPALTEPVRVRLGLPAAAQSFFTAPATIIVPPTFSALAEPARRILPRPWADAAGALVYAPTGETVTVDKWFAALASPTRRVTTPAAQQTLAYSESAQFNESVTEDRWHWPWSDPVRIKPQLAAAAQSFVTAPATVIVPPTFGALSEPARVKLRPAFADPSPYLFAPSTETITPDKWYVGFADPVRSKPGLLAALQQALAYSESAQFAETVSADRWSSALSEPVRAKRLPPLTIDYVPTVATEITSVDKWFVPLADPVRLPIGLKAFLQQATTYTNYFVPEVITLDKWFAWLADPVRLKLALTIAAQQSAAYIGAAPFNEAVTIDRWLMGLSNPQKLARDGVAAAAQQSFTTDTTTPAPPPPPSGDQFRVSGRSVQNLFTHDGVTYPDAAITRRTN